VAQVPAFSRAAEIEASLERLADRVGDPTPQVYARLFARHPQMQLHFWRDTDNAVKGEMLSRTFDAILDFVGERRYADHMIGTEMVTHEGYDVPREVFVTFFAMIRDTAREALGPEWTEAFETAWGELLAEIDRYAGLTRRSDVDNPCFKDQRADFEAPSRSQA
jgi:hemoglobin-like flavoprotein